MSLGPFAIGDYSVTVSWPIVLLTLAMIVAWYWIFLRPIIRILQRTGHSGWWVLLVFVPGGNLGLQILAYGRWPAFEGKNSN
jgi:hypothetical protein